MVLRLTKIVHISSVHPRYDVRIFYKECMSLASQPLHEVHLLIADGKGDELKNTVHIHDVGRVEGRLNRMKILPKRLLEKALSLDGDIYHLHDPELIPMGLRLKKHGKKVIFDSHEDVEKDILSKAWIPHALRLIISKVYAMYERYATQKYDAIVTATPYIRDKFLKIHPHVVDINNYPLLTELSPLSNHHKEHSGDVCYIGVLSDIRGIKELVQALSYLPNVRLHLAGQWSTQAFEREVQALKGWDQVVMHGFLDRAAVAELLQRCSVGLVTLHPLVNYKDALPIKMFEYMAFGLPVVASDFPLWREIIEANQCGVCVNPTDPYAIAQAIKDLLDHPQKAEQMGINGQASVYEKYHWGSEAQKLFSVYQKVLGT